MKKAALILCAVFVLSLAVVVSAEYKMEEGRHLVKLQIEPGWNLVPAAPGGYVISEGYNPHGLNLTETDLIEKDDITAMYVYDIERDTYVRTIPTSNEVVDFQNRINDNPNLKDYYEHTGAWIYTKKRGTLLMDLNTADAPKSLEMPIDAGWNFLMGTPDWYNTKLGNIKGDCELLKAAYWDNKNQKWDIAPQDKLSEISPSESHIGEILLVKVKKQCRFGEGITTIPPLPV